MTDFRSIVSLRAAVVMTFAIACSDSTRGNSTGPETISFSSRAPLPVPRTDHAAVAVGGRIYALGGFSGSTLARVDEYEPTTNTWTQKANMLTARREFAAGVIDGKIYVASGMSFSNPDAVTYIAATEEYDPATNAWTSRAASPTIPAPNSVYTNVHITGAAVNGRLYLVVFSTALSGYSATWEYNPTANTWTSKAAPPFSYRRMAATELNGQLWVLASSTGGATELASYDPSGDVWVLHAPASNIAWGGLGALSGKIHGIGGVEVDAQGQPLNLIGDSGVYDPITNQWGAGGILSVARHSPAVVALGGMLYVIGGSASTNLVAPTPVAAVDAGALP